MSKGENMVERLAQIVWAARMKRGVGLGYDGVVLSWDQENETLHESVRIEVRAVMDELWSRIDLALLDFAARDPDGWARGHEHAKSVVRGYLSTALSQPNEEGEGK